MPTAAFRDVRRVAVRAEGHAAGQLEVARHDLHLLAIVVDDGALIPPQLLTHVWPTVERTFEAQLIHHVELTWPDGNDGGGAPEQRVANGLGRCKSAGGRLIEDLDRVPARRASARHEEALRAVRFGVQ